MTPANANKSQSEVTRVVATPRCPRARTGLLSILPRARGRGPAASLAIQAAF
jgi:hypothetical protein